MHLDAVGYLVARRRREKQFTVAQLAAAAGVGRSTLAALEAGKLSELGFEKVERICAALGLKLDICPAATEAPLMAHRHLTEVAGRNLTKAAIADIIVNGDVSAWRGLARTLRAHKEGGLRRRVQEVIGALDGDDAKVRAFATLLPQIVEGRDGRPRREPGD